MPFFILSNIVNLIKQTQKLFKLSWPMAMCAFFHHLALVVPPLTCIFSSSPLKPLGQFGKWKETLQEASVEGPLQSLLILS